MAQLITYRNISKTYGSHDLFTGIDLTINDDDKIGLIGVNGTGKSTLLRIMAGVEEPDSGEKFARKGLKTVYLAQEDVVDPEKSIIDNLFSCLTKDELADSARVGRVFKIAGQAGFEDPDKKAGILSGGGIKRLAVSMALAQEPDLLFLDEPTNHLDIDGILWLEDLLKNARFSFVLVTHDRRFLDNTVTSVAEIGKYYPDGYFQANGGYSLFSDQRTAFLDSQLKRESALAGKMRREADWLSRMPKARTTKAAYRVDEAHRLRAELSKIRTLNRQNKSVDISFTSTDRKTRKLMEVKEISRSIAGRTIFEDITFNLMAGMRLGIAGGNGSGKTTFMQILAGEAMPDTGSVRTAEGLSVVYFDQRRESVDESLTLRKALSPDSDSVIYRSKPVHIVTWATRFLFRPDQLDQPVSRLSGGEKARILIARFMQRPADVLLLDEPGNDLDIQSIEILEESLQDFPGAVVLVSHDRQLMDNVTEIIIALDGNGGATAYADYGQWEEDRKKAEIKPVKEKTEQAKKPQREKTSSKKISYKDKLELEKIPSMIETAENLVRDLESRLQLPEVSSDQAKLADICSELKHAHDDVDRLYARWSELEDIEGA
ncbi:ABC-F family ATP-binding cassette domain-containing protein [Desulforegula conservatrix]|uniref:ABC-F family ATP-binding cassette domain-containing protein n=1 Tax=Desulforegula conservatrix TaxID=153026 RepID=UPI00041FA849|nr:ABC-F family ATP-binding cassette domain-containing protein [Desulforegula conservatrix]